MLHPKHIHNFDIFRLPSLPESRLDKAFLPMWPSFYFTSFQPLLKSNLELEDLIS